MIWSPAGASRRAFSDCHGVAVGGATTSAPAASAVSVAPLGVVHPQRHAGRDRRPGGRPRPRRRTPRGSGRRSRGWRLRPPGSPRVPAPRRGTRQTSACPARRGRRRRRRRSRRPSRRAGSSRTGAEGCADGSRSFMSPILDAGVVCAAGSGVPLLERHVAVHPGLDGEDQPPVLRRGRTKSWVSSGSSVERDATCASARTSSIALSSSTSPTVRVPTRRSWPGNTKSRAWSDSSPRSSAPETTTRSGPSNVVAT